MPPAFDYGKWLASLKDVALKEEICRMWQVWGDGYNQGKQLRMALDEQSARFKKTGEQMALFS